jgi:hypothetical protein
MLPAPCFNKKARPAKTGRAGYVCSSIEISSGVYGTRLRGLLSSDVAVNLDVLRSALLGGSVRTSCQL